MSTTIRFHKYGGPEVLEVEDDRIGDPGPGQVRLRQEAVGVNFIDTAFRQGIFPAPLPSVAGVEGAGVVEAVGSGVADFQVGDRVAYFLAPGAYAAVRLINAEALLKVPADLSSEQVVTVLTKGLTAWAGLNGFHQLKPGETVLVQGASSSVGTLIARWAKALGATVIGTAGSEEKRSTIAVGIDHALLSGDPDLAAQIRCLAPSGVDVAYEFIGKATFAATAAAVRDGGEIVTIGAASGQPNIDQAGLAARGIRVVGGPMAQYAQPAIAKASAAVFEAYRSGIFGKLEVTRYPLAQAALAHKDIAERRKSGTIVLIP
jgi:NADPH2:quinone reductase